MATSLIDEVTAREADRRRQEWGDLDGEGIPGVRRDIALIVADVLDLLSQDGRMVAAAAVEPGVCWAESGIVWPGRDFSTRCELRAGHAGAHEADRGSMGGTATWTDADLTTPTPAADESGAGA
jgi:hypothetical protein